MSKLILISNPGSASRKYALYEGEVCKARLHFETDEKKRVVYSLWKDKEQIVEKHAGISHLAFAATVLPKILLEQKLIQKTSDVRAIGIRIVAPASFFQNHQKLRPRVIEYLKDLEPFAEIHISNTLQEIDLLDIAFPGIAKIGVSDSAFHKDKPAFAHTYGISQADAKKYDIWRFGYHGLSASSVVEALRSDKKLPERLIICHLGSGSSVSAVHKGKSVDNTMGYSPLEGLVMSTRSGSIDPTASDALGLGLGLKRKPLQRQLNFKSGLLGISGKSSDIRQLLTFETKGDIKAQLALNVYTFRVKQAIGQMAAVLGGVDAIVFTGTVGQRSAIIRERVLDGLDFLGVALDKQQNKKVIGSDSPIAALGSKAAKTPVYVVSIDETAQMQKIVRQLL